MKDKKRKRGMKKRKKYLKKKLMEENDKASERYNGKHPTNIDNERHE